MEIPIGVAAAIARQAWVGEPQRIRAAANRTVTLVAPHIAVATLRQLCYQDSMNFDSDQLRTLLEIANTIEKKAKR